jgi:ABC-type transport system involved in multi-copper enzyme maturation permease subunit
MKSQQKLSPVLLIAKHTLNDEMRQKSFIVMCCICALGVFLIRGCYGGNYMVNGQLLDPGTITATIAKVTFHIIATGVLIVAALLAMRLFKRDRDEGMQAFILSKPISRHQYVAGKILGTWALSVLFMFILHGIIFLITSIQMKVVIPGYLTASLLCAVNLLFAVLAVCLLSLLLPDIMAFLCVLAIGIAGFVGDTVHAVSQSQMVQAMLQQHAAQQPGLSGWEIVYYAWPKLLGTQQLATTLFGGESFRPLYPLANVLFYCLIIGVMVFWRFRKEDIV